VFQINRILVSLLPGPTLLSRKSDKNRNWHDMLARFSVTRTFRLIRAGRDFFPESRGPRLELPEGPSLVKKKLVLSS
jgi:hypothetical protein